MSVGLVNVVQPVTKIVIAIPLNVLQTISIKQVQPLVIPPLVVLVAALTGLMVPVSNHITTVQRNVTRVLAVILLPALVPVILVTHRMALAAAIHILGIQVLGVHVIILIPVMNLPRKPELFIVKETMASK